MTLALTFAATSTASTQADRAVNAQRALQSAANTVDAQPYELLLTLNGTTMTQNGLNVGLTANLVQPGLIIVEYTVIDPSNGNTLLQSATMKSGAS